MAAIYKQYAEEVHIYNHRVPKKDGRDPWLLWLIPVALLLLVRLSMLGLVGLFLLLDTNFKDNLWIEIGKIGVPQLIFDQALNVLLLLGICAQFTKLVFSTKTGEIYSSLFFFRRRIAHFSDIEDIRAGNQEILGFTCHYFSAIWRGDKFKKPIQLSPRVRKDRRLARYHHEIVPLLRYILQLPQGDSVQPEIADEVEDVWVEAVEEAPAPAASALSVSSDNPGWQPKYFVYKEGIYFSKVKPLIICALCVMAIIIFACIYAALFLDHGSALIAIPGGVIFFILLARESLRVGLEPAKNCIHFYTCFGLKKKTLSLDRMIKLTVKRVWPSICFCVVLQGQKVDPAVIETLSMKEIKGVAQEFGKIMRLDVAKWLDV